MGSWFSRSEEKKDKLHIVVLGRQNCGKSYFLDALEGAHGTLLPTTGYRVAEVEYKKERLVFKEVGGHPRFAANLAPMVLQAEGQCLLFIVDVTRPMEDIYMAKQRFFMAVTQAEPKVPVCLVQNVSSENRRAFSAQTINRIFQVRCLAAIRPVATVRLDYTSAEPVMDLLSWTVELIRRDSMRWKHTRDQKRRWEEEDEARREEEKRKRLEKRGKGEAATGASASATAEADRKKEKEVVDVDYLDDFYGRVDP